jgi:cellulase
LGYKEGSNAPVRRYPSPDPINGVDNPAILCRGDNKPVATSAMVNAGDTMTVFWSGYGGGMWEGDEYPGPANMAHNHLGPILTYMASCAGPCSSFDATGKVWYKIDESKTWDGPNLKWATQTLRENGSRYSFRLPPDLKAGEYMLRHEIIALHNARTPGGAQVCLFCSVHNTLADLDSFIRIAFR